MEFILLVMAFASLLVPVHLIHFVLLLAHAVGGVWMARCLLPKQPLCAVGILAYIGMYLLNPLAIAIGLLPLEHTSTESVFFLSNALLMIGLDLFVIGAHRLRQTRWPAHRMQPLYLSALPTEACVIAILMLCAAALVVLISFVGGMGVDIFTVRKAFRVTGGEQSIYYLMTAYAMTLLPFAVFLIGCKRFPSQIVYLAVVAALIVVHFMVFRIRVLSVACMLAYLTAFVVRGYLVTIRREDLRAKVARMRRMAIVIGVPLLGVLTLTVKYLRQAYSNPRFGFEISREHTEFLLATTFAGGDLGYAYWLRTGIMHFPHDHAYLNGQSYYRLLFVPIPRFVWPEKPESTQRIFARVTAPMRKRAGLTIPAGLVGDLYINFGPFGVLGMLVFGFFFALERYRGLHNLLLVASSGYWIFYLIRGSSTTPYVLLLVCWVAARVVTKIIKPQPLTGRLDSGPAMPPPVAGSPSWHPLPHPQHPGQAK